MGSISHIVLLVHAPITPTEQFQQRGPGTSVRLGFCGGSRVVVIIERQLLVAPLRHGDRIGVAPVAETEAADAERFRADPSDPFINPRSSLLRVCQYSSSLQLRTISYGSMIFSSIQFMP